jgi:outer membrane protein assembly factor BamD
LPKHAPAARLLLLLVVIVSAAVAAGCKSRGEEFDMRGSPERIHGDAVKDIRSSNYAGAIQKLELLEARFPFSGPAKQGQLDLLYAYYKNREAESAIDQADQFIRENPTHPRVDYAYFVKGLVYFESGANWLERSLKVDVAKRPPQEASKSFQAFQTLLQQYPRSPYAADARQRMIYLRNRLADYEIAVARYYMKRGAYVGALNRARGLIETYDGAPATMEALGIAADAYHALGMDDLAKVAQNVRNQNTLPDTVGTAAASGAGLAMAQGSGGQGTPGPAAGTGTRDGRWEARIGVAMTNSADVDFEGGTTAAIDSATGFLLGAAYHYSDHLQLGGNLTWDKKDYRAAIVAEDPEDSFEVDGDLESMSLMFDAAYNFLTGPLTPFVAGGIGWTWVDTNIVNAPPDVGCWWDPWYGYICFSSQNTKTINGLAYEVGAGVRYDFSDAFVVDGSYRMRWVDFDNATGKPSFDGFQLNLGWKF